VVHNDDAGRRTQVSGEFDVFVTFYGFEMRTETGVKRNLLYEMLKNWCSLLKLILQLLPHSFVRHTKETGGKETAGTAVAGSGSWPATVEAEAEAEAL
jgi:hypothetical protein